ncbi:MAG: SGNH/GDSL hydrolase family protein [Cyclobacteriaceae bacterium]|nr:SGNH/GDSL hydrolase family protein [Cyclobacteriaceae bacterium]
MKASSTRRKFLKWGSLASLSALANPLSAGDITDITLKGQIPENLTVVFQGDSITDAGRNRSRYYANDISGMGHGYVYQIVAKMLANHPKSNLRCYNRGISGNKVFQLAARWQEDCLQLQPQVLSILIGVNDFWHTLSGNYQGTAEVFEKDLRQLLERTRKQLPEVKLILGEPFAVKGGSAITDVWEQDFPQYQSMVRNIAKDFQSGFVPYQQVFDDALSLGTVDHWCADGVHPSMAGAMLMRDAWLKVFNQMW